MVMILETNLLPNTKLCEQYFIVTISFSITEEWGKYSQRKHQHGVPKHITTHLYHANIFIKQN